MHIQHCHRLLHRQRRPHTTTAPPTAPAAESTRQLVDASEKTTVTVNANAYDTRISEFGCAPYGCKADNTRDGNLSTRWSCQEGRLKDENCEVTYTFEQPQDIVQMLIAFYKGDERAHKLKVKVNGSSQYIIESSGETNGFEAFELDFYGTESLALEGLGLHRDEWIGITEVSALLVENIVLESTWFDSVSLAGNAPDTHVPHIELANIFHGAMLILCNMYCVVGGMFLSLK